jgi:hypothetical protein
MVHGRPRQTKQDMTLRLLTFPEKIRVLIEIPPFSFRHLQDTDLRLGLGMHALFATSWGNGVIV